MVTLSSEVNRSYIIFVSEKEFVVVISFKLKLAEHIAGIGHI